MNIHSRFLVHWTGRDISMKKPRDLSQSEMESFVERLKAIIRDGLRMTRGQETIYGKLNTNIKISTPRICFTEVRLSQAEKHAQEYGLMGIGLSRKFVLSRYGNPVFYVQNGDRGIVVENLDLVRTSVSHDSNVLKAFEVALGFLKNMSDKNKESLKYYDEMEWRIIHSDLLEKEGRIVQSQKNDFYLLKLQPDHIKVIVFPNHKTKKMALSNPWLSDHFFNRKIPMVTTVLDCKNF